MDMGAERGKLSPVIYSTIINKLVLVASIYTYELIWNKKIKSVKLIFFMYLLQNALFVPHWPVNSLASSM